jgi:hypothetical protein
MVVNGIFHKKSKKSFLGTKHEKWPHLEKMAFGSNPIIE